jgi:aminopeptidase N
MKAAIAILPALVLLAGTGAGEARPSPETEAPSLPLRLPQDARPSAYELRLDIDPQQPTYRGQVKIALDVVRPTRQLWLHSLDLTIDEAWVEGDEGRRPARAVARDDGYLGVSLETDLPPGAARLGIRFSGRLDDERSQGIYRVKEPDGRSYVYTFFEPVDARRAFPCFDEPGFKVPWTLSIGAPKGSVAVANSPLARVEAEANGGRRFDFEPTPPLPSYLVAFVVGPFDVVEAGAVGAARVPLRFVLPVGRAGELRYAREVTPRVIDLLEEWFAIPYPFKKLDVAVVPRFWGTMEHPGLLAMGQPLTLIRTDEETVSRRKDYANILVHELAHYWFGDLVTLAWWDDTWLNEGMATWADREVTARVEPAWRFEREAWSRATRAMQGDALASAIPLRKPVATASDITASFDSETTYYKGDALFAMLEHWTGPGSLQRAVKSYLSAHAWGSTTSEDLLHTLERETGGEVAAALRSFVDQPGLPEVTVQWTCGEGQPARVRLAQRRFRPLGQSFDAAVVWKVPVCLRWGGAALPAEKCTLLSSADAEVEVASGGCPRWLTANAAGAGYYHVRYDDSARQSLVDHRSELTAAERYALLRDVAQDVDAGTLDVGVALALAPLFLDDAEGPVVGQALDLLRLIDRDRLPEALLPAYRRMVRQRVGPLGRRLGWWARPDESVDDHDLRGRVLGMLVAGAEEPEAVRQVQALARAWLHDRTAADPDLRHLIVFGAARSGDAALFEAYLAEARRTGDREERALLLGSLAAFPEPGLRRRALSLLLDPDVDRRDSGLLLGAAMSRRESRDEAYTFLKDNFEAVTSRMRDDEKSSLLSTLAWFCDPEHRADVSRFFTPRAAAIDAGPHALEQALASIDACVAKSDRLAPGIAAFLAGY